MTGTWPSYAYTPALEYNGSDSFKYTVTDRGDPDNCEGGPPTCSSRVASAEATVSITVYPVNDQPSASGQTITTNGGAAKLITLAEAGRPRRPQPRELQRHHHTSAGSRDADRRLADLYLHARS